MTTQLENDFVKLLEPYVSRLRQIGVEGAVSFHPTTTGIGLANYGGGFIHLDGECYGPLRDWAHAEQLAKQHAQLKSGIKSLLDICDPLAMGM